MKIEESEEFIVDKMEKNFIDENGDGAKVIIEADNNYQVNMGKNVRYKLAEEMRPKGKIRKRGVFTSPVGPTSHGFAGIMTLAGLVALAGIIIAFITLRF